MSEKDYYEITKQRSYSIVKTNDLIRKARYDLNITELKILAYIISKVKPQDLTVQEYIFSIKEFCMVCGIDHTNSNNYKYIKKTLKELRDKSFWIEENGTEVLVGWLQKARISQGSRKVAVKLDEDLQKYIIGLFDNFTEYQLLSTLPMKSKYSFRMFEILKSYAFMGNHVFDINELKKKLSAEKYENFKDFRRFILDRATEEINLYTDIEISWKPVYAGRKVIQVEFKIRQKDNYEQVITERSVIEEIDGQLSFKDYFND